MAGIYIHIPFCASRCIYCGFYSTVGLGLRQRYVDAVCREMEMRQKPAVDTIYLGGGTPSQLTMLQLEQLFEALHLNYNIAARAEVTIECNPEDISDDFARFLVRIGVNRVSMGAQTFDDERLRFLRRRHDAARISQAVCQLRLAGIDNISIDLMYGFPGETLKQWRQDITSALALETNHLSAYCLTIEDGTPLQRMNVEPCDEEQERQMYDTLIDRLTAAGYEHYEISNFALPGFRSRHNAAYWHDVPYIGLGAAAHSFDGHCRSWNVSDIGRYIAGIECGVPDSDQEVLDADTHYNDRIATALRTREGLRVDTLDERHRTHLLRSAQRYITSGLLAMEAGHLHLTRQGLFVSDMVMSDLMLV